MRRPLSLLLFSAAIAAGLPLGAYAQEGGLFVPVATPTDGLPDNLDPSSIVYEYVFVTGLDATYDNLEAAGNQRYSFYVAWESGTQAVERGRWNHDTNTPAATPPEPARVVAVADWQNARASAPAAALGVLKADPAAHFSTQDMGLRVTRRGVDQVDFVIPVHGPGRRFDHDPVLSEILRGLGKNYEPWKGGEVTRTRVPDPAGGEPKEVDVTAPGLLRLTLGDAEALAYLEKLRGLHPGYGAELRRTAPRIVLVFAGTTPSDFGPALHVQKLRITSRPLEGKPSLTIPLRAFEMAYIKVKPDPLRFAALLRADPNDPEFIDRFNRCPANVTVMSRFSQLPEGTAIRTGDFTDWGNVLMASPGGMALPMLWSLYEDSLDASVSAGKAAFHGVSESPLAGADLLIGHYYYVFDGVGLRQAPANAGSVKATASVSRSSYANTMRSATNTASVEVTVSASGGLKDVFEVGGGVTSSFSNSTTSGSEQGTGKEEVRSVEIEIPRSFSRGAVTVMEYPVFLRGTRRGTSRFTFGVDEKLSHGASARIQEYLLSKGVLRKVVSDTDPDDADKTRVTLAEEISGVDRNVVAAMFPRLLAQSGASVFAGRWRATDLGDGGITYLTVDGEGRITEHGDEGPSERIVDNGGGRATLQSLEDDGKTELEFRRMKSLTTPTLGDGSKIAFTTSGRPARFWIKVGSATPSR